MSKINNAFTSPQSLSEWLKPRLPSSSFISWGISPGTKNVHNLYLELSEGETTLTDSTPPIRTVTVVTVKIFNSTLKTKTLIESHQQLSNGTIRKRSRPLSEKMKPYETYEVAASRAVKEELGSVLVGDGGVKIVEGSYERKVEEGKSSISYPGLPAHYVLHNVDALVDGLPDEDFCTEEHEEYEESDARSVADQAVSVKKHFWKWVDSDSV